MRVEQLSIDRLRGIGVVVLRLRKRVALVGATRWAVWFPPLPCQSPVARQSS